jgi:hypothetical protein
LGRAGWIRLTKEERCEAASEVNETLEEVQSEGDDLVDRAHHKRNGALGEIASGGDEGPHELQDGLEEVGDCFDD